VASPAAAGILAPSIEHGIEISTAAHSAAIAARDLFPSYVAWLKERTGIEVPLNRLGILELAEHEGRAERLQRDLPATATWLGRSALAELEPELSRAAGAVFHPTDGSVDNGVLLEALRALLRASRWVEVRAERAARIDLGATRPAAVTVDGERYEGGDLVLAAGAWVATLSGLPRSLPVEPLRGQMISYRPSPLRHVVYGKRGYLVPRSDDRLLVGATMERAGFAPETTEEGVREMERVAVTICPSLAGRPRLAAWAGLRPVTPDLLPIIGRDPDRPRLVYACGHSRNGVLLAPWTGSMIGGILAGRAMDSDLAPFAVERFAREGGSGVSDRSPADPAMEIRAE
jgi:glycine oxidase